MERAEEYDGKNKAGKLEHLACSRTHPQEGVADQCTPVCVNCQRTERSSRPCAGGIEVRMTRPTSTQPTWERRRWRHIWGWWEQTTQVVGMARQSQGCPLNTPPVKLHSCARGYAPMFALHTLQDTPESCVLASELNVPVPSENLHPVTHSQCAGQTVQPSDGAQALTAMQLGEQRTVSEWLRAPRPKRRRKPGIAQLCGSLRFPCPRCGRPGWAMRRRRA